MESAFNAVELQELGKDGAGVRGSSAHEPWLPCAGPSAFSASVTVPRSAALPGSTAHGFENASYQQDEEQSDRKSPGPVHNEVGASQVAPNPLPSHSYDDDEDEDSGGGGGGGGGEADNAARSPARRPADFGLALALVLLVSGITLVVVAYAVPREAREAADPAAVSARQMERLELYYARLGSHLDRCIIAGLGLLTLGAMQLSLLLMASVCRGDVPAYRRRAAFVRPKRTYGSVNLRLKQLAAGEAGDGVRPGTAPSPDAAHAAERESPARRATAACV